MHDEFSLPQRWLRIALLYFAVAVLLGVAMGASGDHRLMPVHVHLNLLGWVSMALTGLIYERFPAAAATAAARLHFWSYQLALPAMMASLAALRLGHDGAGPLLGASSVLIGLSVALFVATVTWRPAPRAVARAA